MQGFARNKCEMQPKHVLNETDASRCSEQPRQTAHSISMELVESVGPGPSFIFYGLTLLLSANSPPLFALTRQQTLCIHMGQEKSSPPYSSL